MIKMRNSLAALLLLSSLSGCATYSLPGVRLETPEASGREYQVDFEAVGVFSGTDLNERPSFYRPGSSDPEEPPPDPYYAAQSTMRYGVGAMVSVDRKFDVGLRFHPQVPPTLRLKYQLVGEPGEGAPDGNISLSVVAAPGFLPGYFLADFSLPFGYRLSRKHLFWLSPFYTMASLSGLSSSAGETGPAVTGTTYSSSPSSLGAGLGYQFGVKYLFLRAEGAYVLSGAIGEVRIQGISFGALVGFRLQ
jgi:hypothetical protein